VGTILKKAGTHRLFPKEDRYYQCSECGLWVFWNKSRLISIRNYNYQELPTYPEEISCEDVIIMGIIK